MLSLVMTLAGRIEADTGRVAWQIGGSTSVSNVLGAPAPVVTSELAVFAFGSGELQGDSAAVVCAVGMHLCWANVQDARCLKWMM